MIAGSFILLAIGVVLSRQGMSEAGDALKSISVPASLLLASPFTWSKGQPWKAQMVLIGGPLVLLIGAAILSTKI